MSRLKWTVEIEVDDTWIADGFELDADNLKDAVWSLLPHAMEGEFDARIVKAPSAGQIVKAQAGI